MKIQDMGHIAWIVLFCLITVTAAFAETPEQKGQAVAKEADKRDTGWGDQTADLKMILRSTRGGETIRTLRIRTLEVRDDGDESLTIFDDPRDIKGTAFLSYTHGLKDDEQWLYLPALKRVKRIAGANKTSPFVGSEFSYEDIASDEVEKYRYKWLRDETIAGHDVFVIERTPVYEYSGYSREIVWLDKAMYQPLKIEYYDHDNKLLKTLTMEGYKQYADQFWRAGSMTMNNQESGKSTTLVWENYRFGNGLTQRDFDRNALKRVH